jgi:hypothetical protein
MFSIPWKRISRRQRDFPRKGCEFQDDGKNQNFFEEMRGAPFSFLHDFGFEKQRYHSQKAMMFTPGCQGNCRTPEKFTYLENRSRYQATILLRKDHRMKN